VLAAAMLAYGSDSPRSSGDGPVTAPFAPLAPHLLVAPHHQQPPPFAAAAPPAAPPPPASGSPPPPYEAVALSLPAGNVVKLKGLPFKSTTEQDVARFFSAFRFASAAPVWSIFLRRHPDGRLTGEVSFFLAGKVVVRTHHPISSLSLPPSPPKPRPLRPPPRTPAESGPLGA
jgi:hypothetical protein